MIAVICSSECCMLSQHWLSRPFGVLTFCVLPFCVLTFRHHGAAKDRDPKETSQEGSRSTRMMATRRSRLRATRRLAKTWVLKRLPKTRSRSTMMMATRRSRLRATRRLVKTRILRTKMMATRPSERCQSSTAQHRPNRQVSGA